KIVILLVYRLGTCNPLGEQLKGHVKTKTFVLSRRVKVEQVTKRRKALVLEVV
ncbi:unnamed protein product, partial [Larinioides sclopetarius]